MEYLEHARKKTTQKVNLFEKVQIPGYQDAIRKIKRFLEDEESLSKSSQKIMRANLEKRKQEPLSVELWLKQWINTPSSSITESMRNF